MFKVTTRVRGQFKGPSRAFVTYCNISCLFKDKENIRVSCLQLVLRYLLNFLCGFSAN